MTKIMLVEDDKSLREIYGVRLVAEGYEITSAGDGEEALAMAVKEKPDLILADVMMPKISGFDMLDILRSTPETKDIKVVMMTALSSEDQRARGEALGANRYLVKSQVGIEDVVRTIHDVLADVPESKPAVGKFGSPTPSPATQAQVPIVEPRPTISQPPERPAQSSKPVTVIDTKPTEPVSTPEPKPEPPVVTVPSTPVAPTPPPAAEPVSTLPPEPIAEPTRAQAPVFNPEPTSATVQPAAATAPNPQPTELPRPTAPFSTPAPASLGDKIINPITPPSTGPDVATLMEQELSGDTPPATPPNPPQA